MITGISKFSIRNYGCLKDVADVELTPLTAFVGPNDSGKTMLLRALETVGRSLRVSEGYRTVFPDADTFLRQTFGGGGGPFSFEFHGSLAEQPFTYKSELGWAEQGHCQIQQESLRTATAQFVRTGSAVDIHPPGQQEPAMNFGNPTMPMLNEPAHEVGENNRRLRGEHPAFPERINEARAIGRLLASARVFTLRPEAIGTPSLATQSEVQSNGQGLLTAYAQLLLGRREWSDKIEQALRAALPLVERVNVSPTLDPRTNNLSYHLEIATANGMRLPAVNISDGILLYFGYLYLALGVGASRILLLEEPETGIHPGLLTRLVELFRNITDGSHGGPPTQIILTTHSPLLVNLLEPEEIQLVRRDPKDGATRITPFTSNPDIQGLLEYQGPGEVWINQGEDNC